MRAGYGIFFAGAQVKTFPVFTATSSTTLAWNNLTVISPLAGLRLEKSWTGKSGKPFSLFAEANAALPVSGSSENSGPQVSDLSGIEAAARAGVKKTIVNTEDFKLRLGLGVEANYSHFSYTGSWGTSSSAPSTGTFQEYSSNLCVEVDF